MTHDFTRRVFLSKSFALTSILAMRSWKLLGLELNGGTTEATKGLLYVVDTGVRRNRTLIRAYDASTLKFVHELLAAYHPDVAVSADGSQVFICDSDLNRRFQSGDRMQASVLKIYDAKTLDLVTYARVADRPCYGVIPRLNGMAVSGDGRHVFIQQRKTSRKGRIATYDVTAREFLPICRKLPESIGFMAPIPGTQLLAVALQGRKMEDICILDLGKDDEESIASRAGFKFPRSYEDRMSGVALDPSGSLIYVITHSGYLRVLNASDAVTVSELDLEMPEGTYVPPDHLLVFDNYLVVGSAASKAVATSGKADSVTIFDLTKFSRIGSFPLRVASEQLVLAPEGLRVYGASCFQGQSVTQYDNQGAKTQLQNTTRQLVHVAVAPSPW